MAKQALGKGLDALIKKPQQPVSDAVGLAAPKHDGESVLNVEVDSIFPSPLQPRKRFNHENLSELVYSIREHGIFQPLIVRKSQSGYELIAGERRWRAARQLGLTQVPIIVREAGDQQLLELALIENLQREDLNPIEEASGYLKLSKEFGLKQDDIAKKVGKSRASVANAMRLLELDEQVRALIENLTISVGHAKAILSLRDRTLHAQVADEVIKRGMTVRQTERRVQDYNNGVVEKKKEKPAPSAAFKRYEEHLSRQFSAKVAIHHSNSRERGKIEIEYSGSKEIERILELLGIEIEA